MTTAALKLSAPRRKGCQTGKSVRLDPALARIVEALADHIVDQDIRRLRANQPLAAFFADHQPAMSAGSLA